MIDVYDMTHADEVMRPVGGARTQTLNSRMGTGGNQVPVIHENGVANFQGIGQYKTGDKSSTLKSRDYKDATDLAYTHGTVRRLTPTECERLQGLPDGYTAGGSDAARYKAIGNGMAQPCADFVIRRIVEEVAKQSDGNNQG